MDKSQIVLNFIQTCPIIQSNPLFFNFGNVQDNAHQAIIRSDDVALQRPFIDGSVQKRFTFSIDSFKSIAYNPIIVDKDGNIYADENLDEFKDVQELLDWVNEQDNIRNYPNFGDKFVVDEMKTLSTKPDLVGVDTTTNPPIAVYRISIQIDYIDYTQTPWK